MSTETFWTNHSFRDGQTARFKLGPLTAWIRHLKDEWQVCTEYDEDHDDRDACDVTFDVDVPAEGDWQRWIGGVTRRLRLIPAMPDRPVIVRPAARFAISPGATGTFYVRIPVWIRLVAGEKEIPLAEIPSILLSNSWFGAPDSGDFCYSLRTTARRDLDAGDLQPFRARCAMHVANKSDSDELNIQRLCVHARSLAVYEHQGRLHTNSINVEYLGEAELPSVEHLSEPPMPKAKLLCDPRNLSTAERLKRRLNTFTRFRSA